MARTRQIKPIVFKNEKFAEITAYARLLYIGLPMIADKFGRLEYRPKFIKAEILPYNDDITADVVKALLEELVESGFLIHYEVNGDEYLQVANWQKEQSPNSKEVESDIPPMTAIEDNVEKAQDNPQEDGVNCGLLPVTIQNGTSEEGVEIQKASYLNLSLNSNLNLEPELKDTTVTDCYKDLNTLEPSSSEKEGESVWLENARARVEKFLCQSDRIKMEVVT